MHQRSPLLPAGFAAVIAVFVLVTLLAASALERAEASNAWLVHTEQVLTRIESVLTRCVDAETGTRGFLLTDDPHLLHPFDDAEAALPGQLDDLARLTADNSPQEQRVELLRTQVASHIHLLRLLRNDREHDRPLRQMTATEQRQMMLAVRGTLDTMRRAELRLRASRIEEDARAMSRTRVLGTIVVVFMGGLLVWVYLLLEGDERRRAGNAAALREANDLLERRVEERTADWARANAELSAVLTREQQARAELETASRLKDEFLMTISHELRTPLNTIFGWVRMLQSGAIAEDQHARALEIIERNTRAQTRIVEDLLDVSRIITGKLPLAVRRVDLRAIVSAVVESMRPAAAAKSIDLHTRVSGEHLDVTGDPDRLQQVVWNFLSNALKFTPPHGRVDVALDAADDVVRVTVTDSGIGIAPEFLPFVFDRFRQGDSGTTRAHGGLGLGLAIARHLVELHGGSVEVDSDGRGRGTTFRVLLPAIAASDRAAAPETVSSVVAAREWRRGTGSRLDGHRILVVDDEPESRDLLAHVLEHAGACVMTAGSATEAWAVLQADTPDVLVSDIEMPGEDGYTLMRRARALDTHRLGRMVAVAVTAHARAEDRVRALQAGYQWHLPKPLEPAELVSVIESLLSPEPQGDPASRL